MSQQRCLLGNGSLSDFDYKVAFLKNISFHFLKYDFVSVLSDKIFMGHTLLTILGHKQTIKRQFLFFLS